MTKPFIPRLLTYNDELIEQSLLPNLGRVVLVLAEPGAGKSSLLSDLGCSLGAQPRSASLFRHQTTSTGDILIIDALDEVARLGTDALDPIIVKARETGASLVILSSRSSEWEPAQTRLVEECFNEKPSIVRLRPLDQSEQRRLFEGLLPDEDFDAFVAETRRFELEPLLGNPQFLILFAEAYVEGGRHFESKRQIFVDAVAHLARERDDSPKQKGRPPINEIVQVGEEIFAKLLLSGASGISLSDDPAEQDFPYLDGLTRCDPVLTKTALDTRLFKAAGGTGQHEPVHRIVAEYCAAQYLVRRIGDPGDRLTMRRILAIIAPNGAVRDELRGLLGWMAALGDQSLQAECVAIDPYAVLANGDPSQLRLSAKHLLLERLRAFSQVDPYFRRSDSWRRFSVAGFFDDATIDVVRQELVGDNAHPELRDLFLELLRGAEAVAKLVPELQRLVLDSACPYSTRMRAQRLLLELSDYDHQADFSALVALGDRTSLRIAAESGLELPPGKFGRQAVLSLLIASGKHTKDDRRTDDQYVEHRYFVSELIAKLSLDDAVWLLDEITRDLRCTCGAEHAHRCNCLQSISRIAGQLLDRYFSLSSEPHDPERIWRWTKSLRFRGQITADRSASVAALRQDDQLRRAIHRIAFAGTCSAEETWSRYIDLSMSHAHSGLDVSNGDRLALAEYGFEADNLGLWAGLYTRHNRWNTNADRRNELRSRMRSHARARPEFLRFWSKIERDVRLLEKRDRAKWPNRRRSFERREARRHERDKEFFRNNRDVILAGRHWGALRWIADQYLMETDSLVDCLDDVADADMALRNSFEFLKPHLPSLASLIDGKPYVVRVLHAAVLAEFRYAGGLDEIDTDVLVAVKTDLGGYNGYREGEEKRLEASINSRIFPTPADAEMFARTYLEPQLARAADAATEVSWLDYDEAFQTVRVKLAAEWLDRFPNMPSQARETLFEICAKALERSELNSIIERNLAAVLERPAQSEDDIKARDFWSLRALFFLDHPPEEVWAKFRSSRDSLFMVEARTGRFWRSENEAWPGLSAEKIYRLLDMYVEAWPRVFLPNSFGTGDPPEETAYRFLTDIVWRIDGDDPKNSVPVLDRLLADSRFTDFRDTLLSLRASAMRKNALRDFVPPSPAEVVGMLDRNWLATVEDLRALLVEELERVESWVRNSETNPLTTFYLNGEHVDENTARDRIVDRLQARMSALNLDVVIERYMADQNRCDIGVSAMIGGLRRLLVIEVKGQWHKELFSAAAKQLHLGYSSHPDAGEQGIYLVLWFGPNVELAGKKNTDIANPSELQKAILERMPTELHGAIDVTVIDLSPK